MDLVNVLPHIFAALTAYLVITISPGPANVAVMSTAMRNGKQPGLCVGAGIVSGSVCWGIIAAAGLSTFLATNQYAFSIVRILGGLYLCWMGYRALRSVFAKHKQPLTFDHEQAQLSLWRAYYLGFIIHITNPKAVFAWAAVMTLGMQPEVSVLSLALVLIIGGCLLQGIVVTIYALIFSTKAMMNFYIKSRKVIESMLGVLFGGVGFHMLLSIFRD